MERRKKITGLRVDHNIWMRDAITFKYGLEVVTEMDRAKLEHSTAGDKAQTNRYGVREIDKFLDMTWRYDSEERMKQT